MSINDPNDTRNLDKRLTQDKIERDKKSRSSTIVAVFIVIILIIAAYVYSSQNNPRTAVPAPTSTQTR